MGRTAAPATPGESPKTEDLEKAVVDEGLRAETAEASNADLAKKVEELTALVHLMSRNQVGAAVPEQVALPKYDDVMKDPPAIAVLTDRGWYVPAVLPGMSGKV